MSTKINDGGPAFPMQEPQAIHAVAVAAVAEITYTEADKRDAEYLKVRGKAVGGMSMRDYFAGQALQVVIQQSEPFPTKHQSDAIARVSYEIADAMLRAREGGAQ